MINFLCRQIVVLIDKNVKVRLIEFLCFILVE